MLTRRISLPSRGTIGFALAAVLAFVTAAADEPLPFNVQTQTVLQELNPGFCWFHPRVAAIPGAGKEGAPAVVMTIQKHLVADDHYSGLFDLRTDDLGQTWSRPREIPELAWRQESPGVTVAVADVTPGWHAPTGRLLAIGTKVRYSDAGAQLTETSRANECAYAAYDPAADRWSKWQMLELPETEGKFFLVCPGCVQWLAEPDGTLLIPVYFRGPSGADYSATVLHCSFDGQTLAYLEHGDELALAEGRGLVEPSLAWHGGKYFLTLRNDARGYVTASEDGLHFAPLRPWTFDDGAELGSYNTQQHWLAHSDGLFLSYTRRGANNDHIARNRAPLFLAQVDPQKLWVVRATEQAIVPERGVMLGNFGAAAITQNESWVADAEFIVGGNKHERGADGSTYAARVTWSRPNLQVAAPADEPLIIALGDSITKGVRTGVTQEETFAFRLQAALRDAGRAVRVENVGIGGERTDQALARLDSEIVARRPALVAIMYGTNDSYVDIGRQAPRLTREQYRANLLELVVRLRNAGITPVLMTEPRWGDGATPNGAGEHPNLRLQDYMTACREVAAAQHVALVDHFRLWSAANGAGTDVGEWTTDQCHPNPEGHRRMTAAIVPTVERLLGPPARPAPPRAP